MKYMKIQMKCKCVHFNNKKYYCFIMLAEIEHTIPCIFDQCRSVWKSLQVLSAQIHTHSTISVVETFSFVECDFKKNAGWKSCVHVWRSDEKRIKMTN